MARKGRFGEQVQTDYAGNVLKNINEMNKTGNTAAPAGTTDGTANKSALSAKKNEMLDFKREKILDKWKSMTPEQRAIEFANDPVLSGKYTDANALKGAVYKYTSVLNMAPLATTTGKAYNSQLAAYNSALSSLSPDIKEQYDSYFRLGGTLSGIGSTGSVGTGGNILNQLTGGSTPGASINMQLNPDYKAILPGMNKETGAMNLSMAQLDKLNGLRSIVKSGVALTAAQTAKLNKLKANF